MAPKFLLIEPAGDWLGGWQKTLEFDWIPLDIDAMRARLEWQLNLEPPPDSSTAAGEEKGEPVEHRYTLSDLEEVLRRIWPRGEGHDRGYRASTRPTPTRPAP